MTSDIELTTDRDVRIDSTGDIATVSGRENIRQQHVNAIFRGVDSAEVSMLDANGIEEYRMAIGDELDSMPYIKNYSLEFETELPTTLLIEVNTDALDDPVVEEVNL